MLSYFAAWILKALENKVFEKRSGLGAGGETGLRQKPAAA